jgi:hypothetical protein
MRRRAIFGMAWWFRVFVLLTFAVPAAGFAQAAEDAAPAQPDSPVVATDEAEGAALAADAPDLTIPVPEFAQLGASTNGRSNHVVHLGVDGNLAGRVSALDASGTLFPVRATIRFVRDGRTVTSVRSDEMGNFQAVGLRPGPYSVIASNGRMMSGDARDYVGATAVLVLPYDPTALPEQLLLNMVLIPMEDLAELISEQLLAPGGLPIPPGMMPGGFPMMCGGGGGEGLAALLGLAGLAGLAGGQGRGAGARPPVASPFVP